MLCAPGYMSGLGNQLSTEAVPGALPVGRNSPQKPALGLYAEQISGTAFTAPRHENHRSWLYRRRPSADHPSFTPYAGAAEWLTPPFAGRRPEPNRLRWSPLPAPDRPTDFIDGMVTMAGAGDPQAGSGTSISHYAINRPMDRRALVNADAEMLIIPQQGRLHIVTEMGVLEIGPLEIALIPRGMKMKLTPTQGTARGYLCENMGASFRLPELGPIGSNGLASPRDFEAPVAAFESDDAPHELVMKYMGSFWSCPLGHSPFDVVAWHGNLAPWRYDLRRFNTMNTVSFDHPDPSIFTVLTSPSDTPGTANADFVIFPPRWMVAEETFRPPWFHRNVMSEYMGLITGQYDAKAEGFVPGGASLHNMMSAHGPDVASHRIASDAALAPHKLEGTMAFMIETRFPLSVTPRATASAQADYDACWRGFSPAQVLP